jgi:hypothetical protein
MGIHGFPVEGKLANYLFAKANVQLKDPHARSFTHVELREAMMETLRFINSLLKAAGVVSASASL